MIRKLQGISFICAIGSFIVCSLVHSKELVFKWGIAEDAYELSTHFKDRLTFSLLQENVRSTIEKTLLDLEISHRVFVEAKFLPCQFSVFFDDSEDRSGDRLEKLISEDPFCFLEDLEFVRAKYLEHLEKEKSLCLVPDYTTLLKRAIKGVEEVSEIDLISIFNKSTKEKGVSFPFLIQSYLEESNPSSETFATESFFSLSLREEDKELIRQLVSFLANKNILQIVAARETLELTKNRLKLVHPFRFLVFALTDSALRPTLEVLHKSSFKWDFLVKGLERGLRRKKEAKALDEYISGFADLLGVEESVIHNYVDHGSFREMIGFLISLNR